MGPRRPQFIRVVMEHKSIALVLSIICPGYGCAVQSAGDASDVASVDIGVAEDALDAAVNDAPELPECDASPQLAYQWRFAPDASGLLCHSTYVYGSTANTTGGVGFPVTDILITPFQNVGLPRPLCSFGFEVYNLMPRSGDTGPLGNSMNWRNRQPLVVVFGSYWNQPDAECAVEAGVTPDVSALYSQSGTYHVVRGGTWGDDVEIELRDVRLGLVFGREFSLPFIRFRGRLPTDIIRYP